MDSSLFSTFCSISVLILLEALISPGFNQIIGSESGSRAMAIEDGDYMALLPFGSRSVVSSFIRSPQCGGPRPRDEFAVITVKNSCTNTIWPATLTAGPGQPQLSTTGFELAPGASRSLNVRTPWTGQVWARTFCTNDDERHTCLTGDCSRSLQCNGAGGVPPFTLVEFTLANANGTDFYDVSLVNGFNIPASITTQDSWGRGPCKSPSCRADVNKVCPAELQVKSNNEVIGCLSACSAFKQSRYCCTGEFIDPNKCKPTTYSQIFKNQCPDAYSYAYDDKGSAFSCSNNANYVITFCG